MADARKSGEESRRTIEPARAPPRHKALEVAGTSAVVCDSWQAIA
jgi:hypothetical protein